MSDSNVWVAKCKTINNTFIDLELSPRFSNVYDCQKYINENLQVLEFLLSESQKFIDFHIKKDYALRFGSYIRCYNVSQKRFANSFDY